MDHLATLREADQPGWTGWRKKSFATVSSTARVLYGPNGKTACETTHVRPSLPSSAHAVVWSRQGRLKSEAPSFPFEATKDYCRGPCGRACDEVSSCKKSMTMLRRDGQFSRHSASNLLWPRRQLPQCPESCKAVLQSEYSVVQ